jgi:uncharacterized membrane protein required for colicin V production
VTITFFDILILLALFGGAVVGFYRGFRRQAAVTLMLYVSIVVAALFHPNVSYVLVRLTGQMSYATDVLAFFLLMGLVLGIFFVMLNELTDRDGRDRRPIWHNIVGMVFGFLNAAILCSITLIVLRSAANGEPWIAYAGIQAFLRRQMTRSWMVYVFSPFRRLLLTAVEPWLFGSRLPPLLRNAL